MSTRHSVGFTRRRFLSTFSGAAVLPLTGCRSSKIAETTEPTRETLGDYLWSGIGFGIEMSMELVGVTATKGDSLGQQCEQHIRELEQAFSLYREDSELSILNRERILQQPSPVFRKLIELALRLQVRTLGYFEPAVHGALLWLKEHGSTEKLEGNAAWLEQCAACNMKYLEITSDGAIRLTNPLTMLSMNAIGQGFLADTVAACLRAAGVTSALLHLGETYAIGKHPEGRLWKLAVTGNPSNGETGMLGEIDFADAGLAVSAQDATRIMIDPVACTVGHQACTVAIVSSEGAAVADAFATAYAVSPAEQWARLASRLKKQGSQVHVWVENELRFTSIC